MQNKEGNPSVCSCFLTPDNETELRRNSCPIHGVSTEDGKPKQSEVSRILAQIEAEYTASFNALHGLAQGSSRHAFITARMENIGELQEHLEKLIGDQAIGLIAKRLDQLNGTNP